MPRLSAGNTWSSIRQVKRKQSMWAKRATKMVLMVIALFVICWSPYHIIQVINLGNNKPTIAFVYVYNISICLSYSHSCINPLMLLIFAHNYLERLCRRNTQDSSQHSSKATVVRKDGSSMTNDPNCRITAI
uniref:Melanin-concentrating hormone receptor 2 n=1 Tax=Nothobranchius kuhntae TaxID=321403 RepID=A0A1A8JET4_NOTKU